MTKLGITAKAGYGLGVTVSSMGVLSYQKVLNEINQIILFSRYIFLWHDVFYKAYRYHDGSIGNVTFPLLMAIISVDRGKVNVRLNKFVRSICINNNTLSSLQGNILG
jgi:hypothetical protein